MVGEIEDVGFFVVNKVVDAAVVEIITTVDVLGKVVMVIGGLEEDGSKKGIIEVLIVVGLVGIYWAGVVDVVDVFIVEVDVIVDSK